MARFLWLCFLIVLPAVSSATTIVVPTDQPTIAAALGIAAAGDTIEVDCGVYTEHSLDMVSDVVLRSATGEPDCVTLDLGGNTALQWMNLGALTRIEGFTFINGYTPLNIDESLGSVDSCVFRQNGGNYGGGIESWLSTIAVTDCVFDSNMPGGDGGLSLGFSHATVDGCEFVNNDTFEGAGAIWLSSSSSLEVTNSRFEGNVCFEGGAIWSNSALPMVVEDCVFVDNEGTGAVGGAVGGNGDLTARRCTFSGNTATWGGAVYVGSSAEALIEDSVFYDNQVDAYGGAVASRGLVTLRGCTMAANRAGLFGGGVAVTDGGSVELERSVIAFGTLGGAVYCDPTTSVTLSCVNVFGNIGGDWVGCIAPKQNANGNLHLDPLFCDLLGGDLTVAANSFLLASNNPCMEQIGALGQGCAGQITSNEHLLPAVLALGRPRPNPFNPRTTVPFFLPSASPVRLTVHDARGRQVAVLVNELRPAGEHDAVFEGLDARGESLASGVYFARLEAMGTNRVTRLVLVR